MTKPQTQSRLLVVDDDRRLRELLVKFLSENDFLVSSASNAAEARAYLASQSADLIVLDIMMPGEDGLTFMKSLSQNGENENTKARTIPVLFLTARDQVDDRIKGLDVGADDYLTKPFEPRELLARIKAILRRASPVTPEIPCELDLGEYCFNPETGLLKKGEEVVFLSSTELVLLKILAQNPHKPFSREDLAIRIGHRVSERTIDVQITRLRRKIGDDPRQPRYLQTVRHIGYMLSPD